MAQVYGWLLDDHGRVLVQDTPGGWNLPGGRPEVWDADASQTLIREAMEESQVEVDDVVMVGYEETVRTGRRVALLRATARITTFAERHPDPDSGHLLGRHMMSVAKAAEVLGWGDVAEAQAHAASAVALERWGLPVERPTAEDVVVP